MKKLFLLIAIYFFISSEVVSAQARCDTMRLTASINYYCVDSICIDILSVSGGTPSYYYLWVTGTTTSSICVESAGQYCVHVIDTNGCTLDTCFFITLPPLLKFTIISQNPTCHGCNDGSITVDAWAGVPPYRYTWSPPVSSDSSASALTAGAYVVCVTDTVGCTECDTVVLTDPLYVWRPVYANNFMFTVSENKLLLSYSLPGTISIYNMMGKKCYSECCKETVIDISSFSTGMYFMEWRGENQRWISKFIKQ